MKKMISIVVLFVAVISLTMCGCKSTSGKSTAKPVVKPTSGKMVVSPTNTVSTNAPVKKALFGCSR
jgi:hypothetical protein